jgi:type IV secretory pathway VirB2 component (pilin)
MEETAADMDAPAAAPDEADVDLNRIYDRPEAVAAADAASLARYDPEAGRTSVAVKVRAVTQAVRNTVATPFGKLVVTLPIILLGISLTIAAVTIQDLPYIIAAVLVMPVSLFLTYWRYQVWLGHKRYLYRLLETLGEDVSDFDPHRMYRKAGKRMAKRKR